MTDALLFGIFGTSLLCIARWHQHALRIAAGGMLLTLLVRVLLTEDFVLLDHLGHEWRILLNLAGLLLGFAVLANHFERSHLPERLTEVLPQGRSGPFLLLALTFVMSAVLDNIAAALIGGSAAITLFRRKVHIGYLAAIVAASNAGGAGSVIGDTTTTMMWIEGASPLWVAPAFLGAAVALLFFGTVASGQQHRLQPLVRSAHAAPAIDLGQVIIVVAIIAGAIATNVLYDFPAAGVWGAIVLGAALRRPDWRVLPAAATGTLFLLCLVLMASMMPVKALPAPTAASTLVLGFVSAFFDNIPLTKLAIDQGGYDWAMLAYAVGYGGSMLWFGSSAGIAISGLFPETKSVKAWLQNGWHVAVGYLLGFAALYLVFGWTPHALERPARGHAPAAAQPQGH